MVFFSFILRGLPGFPGCISTIWSCFYLVYRFILLFDIHRSVPSAVTVSQDTTLRISIKKSMTEQAKFLDGMGSAHMEQELQSTVMKIAKKQADVLTEKTGVESSMTESDIKEYMAMVMNEIHKS